VVTLHRLHINNTNDEFTKEERKHNKLDYIDRLITQYDDEIEPVYHILEYLKYENKIISTVKFPHDTPHMMLY
jgi:hypothetical protein